MAHFHRAVESDIVAYVDDVLATPDSSLTVFLLVGMRGVGIRSLLVRGVAPRLAQRATQPREAPTQVRGEWHASSLVQFCVDEADVPAAPPPDGCAARVLLVACFDVDALPRWVVAQESHSARTLPISPLTHFEVQGFVEACFGGPVEPAAARRLAELGGFMPNAMAVIIDECRSHGALERVDGVWMLLGDPVQLAIVPYLRAQLATAGTAVAGMLTRLALIDPFTRDQLTGDESTFVDELIADGEVRGRSDGRLEFTGHAAREGLRALAPADVQQRVYAAELRGPRPSVHAIRWAARTEHPLESQQLERAATTALHDHDWQAVLDVAEIAEIADTAEPTSDADPSIRAAVRCALHARAASAARFLPDADLAHAHLDRLEDGLPDVAEPERDALHRRARILRAELLHYNEGDVDAALAELESDPRAADDPLVQSNIVLHLAYGGRHRPARATLEASKRALRRAPRQLRDRVAVAEALLMVAGGRPAQAFRAITLMAARHRAVAERSQWLHEELRAAYVTAALSSDGPSAFTMLEKHLGASQGGQERPDQVTFSFAQAAWEYARGDIAAADRLGSLALATAESVDPLGMQAAAIALVAETSALRGDRRRAIGLVARFAETPVRAAAVIAGSVHGHVAAAQLLVETPGAGESLRRVAAEFAEAGQFGFAADVLAIGVRFGRRRAASDLCEIADALDGRLHELRVAQANALLTDDPVAMLAVADGYQTAGLALLSAEADASALRMPSVPDSVRHRASGRVASMLSAQQLPGHTLLGATATGVVGEVRLTPREREVTELIDLGLTNAEIAARLDLSLATIEGHITRIYRKTGARRRAPSRR